MPHIYSFCFLLVLHFCIHNYRNLTLGKCNESCLVCVSVYVWVFAGRSLPLATCVTGERMRDGSRGKALSHCLYDKRKQNSSLFYSTCHPWPDQPVEHAPSNRLTPTHTHWHTHAGNALGRKRRQLPTLYEIVLSTYSY